MAKRINIEAILSKTKDCHTEEQLKELAKAIRDKFPTGKMSDNTTYWRQSVKDISYKLLKFFTEYDDDYTMEEILKATDNYIANFKYKIGYSGMRCSKYFIVKDDKVSREQISDLSTYLDQLRDGESEENIDMDSGWLGEIR